MPRIIALDPGTYETAMVAIDRQTRQLLVRDFGPNQEILERLVAQVHAMPFSITCVAIEMVASYGMPVGREVFETCVWIGRFVQAIHGTPVRLITRNEVKMALCHQIKQVNDAVIRRRLIDLYGPTDKEARGTKKVPGPLYGVTKHLWSALAVAVTVLEQEATPHTGEKHAYQDEEDQAGGECCRGELGRTADHRLPRSRDPRGPARRS